MWPLNLLPLTNYRTFRFLAPSLSLLRLSRPTCFGSHPQSSTVQTPELNVNDCQCSPVGPLFQQVEPLNHPAWASEDAIRRPADVRCAFSIVDKKISLVPLPVCPISVRKPRHAELDARQGLECHLTLESRRILADWPANEERGKPLQEPVAVTRLPRPICQSPLRPPARHASLYLRSDLVGSGLNTSLRRRRSTLVRNGTSVPSFLGDLSGWTDGLFFVLTAFCAQHRPWTAFVTPRCFEALPLTIVFDLASSRQCATRGSLDSQKRERPQNGCTRQKSAPCTSNRAHLSSDRDAILSGTSEYVLKHMKRHQPPIERRVEEHKTLAFTSCRIETLASLLTPFRWFYGCF